VGIFPALRRSPPARSGNPNAAGTRSLTAAGSRSGAEKSLVAAGFRVTHQDTDKLRRLIQPWQSRAFTYYDRLGEIKYASQFYARMLAPLRLYVAKKDENGDYVEIDPGQDEVAQSALDRIQDPGGGRESLLSSYGRLMFLTGECYLFCTLDEDTGLEQWEMLSTDELRIQSGAYIRYRSPSLMAEEFREASDDDWEPVDDEHAIAYRLWKRHPRYSELADSTMMGVLDLCEELLLLTLAVRARARSRLAGSGVLLIADEISYAPLEAVPDEDPDEDPLLRDLKDAMITPIQDEGAASAVVPLVIRAPLETIKDGFRHVQIVDPTQLYPETGLRRECIERIAIGLDMPPEILLGMSDANHWTVWMIDEQTWKAHGQPIANQLVNDLNSAYFLPQLRDDGLTDWDQYAIQYDAAAIINHPDRFADAQKAYDRRAIGKAALRDAGGFDEDDAPTDDELKEMIGIAVRDGSLALFGIPSVKAGGIEVEPGEVVSPAGDASGDAPAAKSGAEVEPGPPAEGAPKTTEAEEAGLVGSLRAAQIAGAADLALLRAREAAGNRLRSLAKRDPDLHALLEDMPARDIAAYLGPDRVRALGVADPRELVNSGTSLVVDALALWRIGDAATVLLIAEQVEQHAARTLFEERPTPLPPQFRSYVAGVVDAR
jgi:hypothetical protein